MDLSTGSLLASLFVSTIGLALFRYGRKEVRLPQTLVGMVLMIFPYFVPGAIAMWSVATVLLLGMLAAVRAGY